MTASPRTLSLDALLDRACARIAPTWPLDRLIAVNPFWGRVRLPMPAVAGELAALSGARLLMPRSWYREAWWSGTLRHEHLAAAIEGRPDAPSVAELVALLDTPTPTVRRRERVMDVADRLRPRGPSWRDHVTHSTSQSCAAWFDHWQADLAPDRTGGLYASWRRTAVLDRAPALAMGLDAWRREAAALPTSGAAVIAEAIEALGIPVGEQEAWATGLLLDLGGWASWCAWRRWTARLGGGDDDAILDLLAIRAAWELVLYRCGGPQMAEAWASARAEWEAIDEEAGLARAEDWFLQRAVELAYAGDLVSRLPLGLDTPRPAAAVQAVFCIDVRSEPWRRAFEAQSDTIQTLGFAGFFGLPAEHVPLGASEGVPRLPGLLAARVRITETGGAPNAAEQRAAEVATSAAWRAFQGDPASAFSFVENLGLPYAAKLVRETLFGRRRPRADQPDPAAPSATRPRLTSHADGRPLDIADRVRLAASILRGMSLTRAFARLVLLVGHGSEVTNNAHRAGLDCGACCGSTGEVSARAAAALLNEPRVRDGLRADGIDVPDTTRFLPALHNTTTDDVTLLEVDTLPLSHAADLARLRDWLTGAAATARAARVPRLAPGADPSTEPARRASDWAEVRPEWGLAGNAALIVAPREHIRHLDLGGRAFLHEYRADEDPGFAVLEAIMTAPMVVAHWINLQYYASTVDNLRYGSGNKLLHNVVGGHIGVFEGNGGDLRIGLPLQSLHDGRAWVHTPLRLQVFVEAPRDAIEGVLARHEVVRDLVRGEWLHLYQIDRETRRVTSVGVPPT